MGISAVIFGCSGTELLESERAFYEEVQPWGFILFGRNIDNPAQVKKLTSDLKSCVKHEDVPILIDQEGGRVRRLRPPHWADYHSGREIGARYDQAPELGLRAAWLQSRLMAFDLVRLGINVDCLPVLDVPVAGSHDVIGDRAYSNVPSVISDIGRAASQGLLDGGVSPVIKHIPGHGRASVDSHKDLPRVSAQRQELERTDFLPFQALNDMPMAMTAHVVYEAIDSRAPATTSKTVIKEVIRGFIGFDGLLMCDDLSMHALSGDFQQRTQSAFAAGCDVVLHCNGEMDEMRRVAEAVEVLAGRSLQRALRSTECFSSSNPDVEATLRSEFADLIEGSVYALDPTEGAA